jgi:CelD/BcsL family acetyltransferase involved in cellulose biosynthesis
MRIFLTRPDDLGPAEIAMWRSMQKAVPYLANPFLSPEFALAVGRFRPAAHVAVLTEGQSVVGFFPFERRRLGVGVPIGGWLSHFQGLIHAPGAEWDPQELLRGCRLSAWRFDNLAVEQEPFRPHHAATGPSPVIDVAAGFAAYYANLQMRVPRFCRELARKARKIEREVGELRIVADSRDVSALHTLLAWKSDQYRRTGCVDSFGRPWMADLLEALLAHRSDDTGGLLSVLYAGDQPVAAQFGLRTGNLLVGWHTGYDVRFARYSPGFIHLMQMAEQLAAAGLDAIYMGKGALRYAKHLKSYDVFVAEGVVNRRSALGTAHGIRAASCRWATQTVREHPALYRRADWMLRRSGVSRLIYGRM